MKATIKFDTIAYESSYGRKPKGTGMWAFSHTRNPEAADDYKFFYGTLTEAKAQAKAYYTQVAQQSWMTIYILP